MIKTFLLLCPGCGNKMKYQTDNPSGKTKRCVYCGRNFIVHGNGKTQIIKQL